MNTIGERIKAARKRARLSQEGLARRAGMSTNGVARIEQGGISDPHYSTLLGIAHALDVPVGELLSEEPVLSGKAEAPFRLGPLEALKQRKSLGLVKDIADAAKVWTRLVADPRLSEDQRVGILAAARVLEDQLSVSLGAGDLPEREQRDVSTALVRVSRVDEQYENMADLAARLDAIAALAKEHEKAVAGTQEGG